MPCKAQKTLQVRKTGGESERGALQETAAAMQWAGHRAALELDILSTKL